MSSLSPNKSIHAGEGRALCTGGGGGGLTVYGNPRANRQTPEETILSASFGIYRVPWINYQLLDMKSTDWHHHHHETDKDV